MQKSDAIPVEEPAIALWIGDKPVSLEELKYHYQIFLFERGFEFPQSEQQHSQLLQDCIRDLSESAVLEKEAQKRDIDSPVNSFDIAAMTEDEIEFPDGFGELSDQQKQWRDRVKQRFVLMQTAALISEQLSTDIQITDEQVQAEYEMRTSDFIVPMLFDLRVIRLDNKETAEDLYKKLQRGWSFVKLAEQYSIISGEGAAGVVMRQYLTDFPNTFTDILKSIRLHQTTPVLESDSFFYLYYVENRYPEEILPLEQVRDNLKAELLSKERSRRYNEWMNQQIKSLDVRIGTPIPYQRSASGVTQ